MSVRMLEDVIDELDLCRAKLRVAEANARRYEYWRDCGICISDAPVSFLFLEELDKFTDQAIAEESGSG